jgi:septum formation inhibitor-activating ATPase MinD
MISVSSRIFYDKFTLIAKRSGIKPEEVKEKRMAIFLFPVHQTIDLTVVTQFSILKVYYDPCYIMYLCFVL